MNDIQTAFLSLLPANRKTTPSGWTSFNSLCCHHRGEKPDTRKRGGTKISSDGSWTYHCFNCNFKAGWSPGKLLSKNTKDLFKWMGMNEVDIGKLNLAALKIKDGQPVLTKSLNFELKERELPKGTMSIIDWINSAYTPDIEEDIGPVIEYIINRGMQLDWYNWMWSAQPGYKDRVIIPFYHEGKIVGWTGRKITDGKPKYLTDAQPGYVFNIDAQTFERKYIIVVEGQFDAIAINGCAIMHNEPNETQCNRINMLNKEVIVVPDKDRAGAKMLKAALAHGWSASMPPWEDNIKDVADAVKRYGRLYTLTTILKYSVHGEINLNLLKRKLENVQE